MKKTSYVKWVPVVIKAQCTGCNRCVIACDANALEMREGLAELVRPEACGSESHCVRACKDDAIHMEWMHLDGDRTRGKWGSGGRVWPGRVRGLRPLARG